MTPDEKTLADNMHKALGVRQVKHWKVVTVSGFAGGPESNATATLVVQGKANMVEEVRSKVETALNSHDDLVAACKRASAAICRREGTESQYEVLAAPKTIEILQAAIAKAEGNS